MKLRTTPRERLTYYRNRKGWSYTDLAEKIGYTPTAIHNLEIGWNEIYYEDAELIAAALNIDINLLLDTYSKAVRKGVYGKTIKQVRQSYNMTQVEFAKLLNVDRSKLAIWEVELHRPNRLMYNKIMRLKKMRKVEDK